MNNLIFGKTDRLTVESLDMSPEVQILALNAPSVIFSDDMKVLFRKEPTVSRPIIGITKPNGQVCHLVQQLLQHLILPSAVLPSQDNSRVFFSQIPSPTGLFLTAHIAPKLIPFGSVVNLHFQTTKLLCFYFIYQIRIHLAWGLFFKWLHTVFGLIPKFRAISRTPLLLRVC